MTGQALIAGRSGPLRRDLPLAPQVGVEAVSVLLPKVTADRGLFFIEVSVPRTSIQHGRRA